MNYSEFKTGNKNKLTKSLHVKFRHHIGQLLCSNRQCSTWCLCVSTYPCEHCWSHHPQLRARSLPRQRGGRPTASSPSPSQQASPIAQWINQPLPSKPITLWQLINYSACRLPRQNAEYKTALKTMKLQLKFSRHSHWRELQPRGLQILGNAMSKSS